MRLSAVQTSMYQAESQLIYQNPVDTREPSWGLQRTSTRRCAPSSWRASRPSSPDPSSRRTRRRSSSAAHGPGALKTGYEVSSEVVAAKGDTAGTTYSSVVAVIAQSSDAQLSAVAANSYADAFIQMRKDRQRSQIAQAIDVTRKSLDAMKGATKQSADYIMLQQRLHDLKIVQATATGGFTVVVPATTPDSPYAPKPLRSAAIGLALGLFVGLGLAFLLELLDTSVRSDSEVAELLRLPILARIPRISKRLLDQSALVTLSEPDGTSAEAFRMLRTNLSFMSVDGDVRSVLLTSCVQGEGKSVTIANLAMTLALGGKRVIVVDADLRRPRMHSYFGLPNERGVSTVVSGQSELKDSLQPVPVVSTPPAGSTDLASWASGNGGEATRLYVLTSGPTAPNPGEIVSSRRFGELLETLSPLADIVLVDSPAMLAVGDTPALGDKVDGLLFLVEPDVVRKQQLAQAREQLDKLPCAVLGLIIARRKTGSSYYAPRYYYRETEDGKRVRAGRSSSRAKAPDPLS